MSYRWAVMLAFATIVLSPAAAGADEPRGVPPHIAAVRAFLVAWGHERWDDLRDVAADAVTVTLADKVFSVEPASRKSDVTVLLPFRGLSTVRDGAEIKSVTVADLGVRVGDQEMRGPATVTLADEAGRFRVVGVSVDGAR